MSPVTGFYTAKPYDLRDLISFDFLESSFGVFVPEGNWKGVRDQRDKGRKGARLSSRDLKGID